MTKVCFQIRTYLDVMAFRFFFFAISKQINVKF